MPNNQNLALQKNPNSGSSKTTRLTHIKHAMNAQCWDCCGGGLTQSESKGVRKEIALCTITDCSLWNFRHYKNNETANTLAGVAVSNLSIQQTSEKINHE